MLADQCFLNSLRPLGINFLLTAHLRRFFLPGRMLGGVMRGGCRLAGTWRSWRGGRGLGRILRGRCRNQQTKHANCTEASNCCGASTHRKKQSPNRLSHCNHLPSESTVPDPIGRNAITEVYRPGKSYRPVETCRAAAPGRPHLDRSSWSTRFWQSRLRCSPAVCSLQG